MPPKRKAQKISSAAAATAAAPAAAAPVNEKVDTPITVYVLGCIDVENKPRLYEILRSVHLTKRSAVIEGIAAMVSSKCDDGEAHELLWLLSAAEDPALVKIITSYVNDDKLGHKDLHKLLTDATEIKEELLLKWFEECSSHNGPYYYDIESRPAMP